MAEVSIRGRIVDVDIRTELEEYSWHRAKWSTDKLIAASPFRHDNTPSFYVHLEGADAGYWGDSGYYDAEWAKGGLVKLLAFLRNETTEETEEYLLGAYNFEYDSETITLNVPTLTLPKSGVTSLSADHLANLSREYSYLQGRGIGEEVQRQAGVLYDAKSRAIVIPWFDAQGLRNIKYRATYGKVFWYAKGATPVRELVYGIETIATDSPAVAGPSVAVLEEAEIDALSWRQAGMQAIAVGGANFTDKQADIIKRSSIKTLLIGGDNDKAGDKFAEQVAEKLRGYVELRRVEKPARFKDANEAIVAGENLRSYQSRPIKSVNVDNFRPHVAKLLL